MNRYYEKEENYDTEFRGLKKPTKVNRGNLLEIDTQIFLDQRNLREDIAEVVFVHAS